MSNNHRGHVALPEYHYQGIEVSVVKPEQPFAAESQTLERWDLLCCDRFMLEISQQRAMAFLICEGLLCHDWIFLIVVPCLLRD